MITTTEWADVCSWICDHWPRYVRDWGPERAARLYEDFADFDLVDVRRVVEGFYEEGAKSIGSSEVYGKLKAADRQRMSDRDLGEEYCTRRGHHTLGSDRDDAIRQATENGGKVRLDCTVCYAVVVKSIEDVFAEWEYGEVPTEIRSPGAAAAYAAEDERHTKG